MDEPYRSYVVRIHRPRGSAPVIRLDIEDLQRGGRAALQGAVARRLARLLSRLVVRDGDREDEPGS